MKEKHSVLNKETLLDHSSPQDFQNGSGQFGITVCSFYQNGFALLYAVILIFFYLMFAPLYMLKYADDAMIQSPDGTTRPFVLSKSEIVKGRSVVLEKTFPLSPLQVVWIVYGLVGILTILERRYEKCFWWLDAILLTLQGGIGLVVAMLFFFSVHPTVDSNWLIIVFNPIPLLAMPWVVYSAIKHQRNVYHFVASVVLTLFIIFSALMPQNFNAVVVPLVLILLLRSCNYVFIYLKR